MNLLVIINADFLRKAIEILNFFMAMYVSELVVNNPVFGGALYLCGQIFVLHTKFSNGERKNGISRYSRIIGIIIFVIALLFMGILLFLYPKITMQGNIWYMAAFVVAMLLRSIITDVAAINLSGKARRYALLFIHAVFFVLLEVVFLGFYKYEDSFLLITAVNIISSSALMLQQIFAKRYYADKKEKGLNNADINKLMNISAYKIYNNTILTMTVAIVVSLMMQICFIRFSYGGRLISDMLISAVWIGTVLVITYIMFMIISKTGSNKGEMSAMFIFGAAAWIVSGIMQKGNFFEAEYFISVWNILWAFGMACMFSSMLSMVNDMRYVVELALGNDEIKLLRDNTNITIDFAIMISNLIMMAVLTVSSFFTYDKPDIITVAESMKDVWQVGMIYVPLVFVAISALCAALQPLDKRYAQKLAKYMQGKEKGIENKTMEERLKLVLVKKNRRRFGIKIIAALLRPLYKHKIVGKENVDFSDGPVVFTCNHSEIYGPLVTNLFFPFYYRQWTIAQMTDKNRVYEHMYSGTFEPIKWLPGFLKKAIARLACPLMIWIINSTDPIPVYMGLREVTKTINETVDSLIADDNILLFPENPHVESDGRYKHEGVSEFHTGFFHIAKAYYKRTGKSVSFYPVFADKKTKTMYFGKGIKYNANANAAEEKERIVGYLYLSTKEMSEKAGKVNEDRKK